MPKITIYNPRGELEVQGEAAKGDTLLEASVELGAHHGSACGGVLSCSTCHIWVKEGGASLGDQEDGEMDILDRAFDVKPSSRLGCQAILANQDVVYQITEESERTCTTSTRRSGTRRRRAGRGRRRGSRRRSRRASSVSLLCRCAVARLRSPGPPAAAPGHLRPHRGRLLQRRDVATDCASGGKRIVRADAQLPLRLPARHRSGRRRLRARGRCDRTTD
jgi:2Fe-2S ferredoxin